MRVCNSGSVRGSDSGSSSGNDRGSDSARDSDRASYRYNGRIQRRRQRPYPRPQPDTTDITSTGVPGPHLCRNDLSAEHPAPHKCRPGSLGKRDEISSPGNEEGRRRAIGVVVNPRATTPMVRRWAAVTTSQRPRRPAMTDQETLNPPIFNRASPNRLPLSLGGPIDSLGGTRSLRVTLVGATLGLRNHLIRPNAGSCAEAPTCAIGDQVEPRCRSSDCDRGSGRSSDSGRDSVGGSVPARCRRQPGWQPSGDAERRAQFRCRATLAAKRSGASLPAAIEAAGARAAWSPPFNLLPAKRASPRSRTPSKPRLAHSQLLWLGASLRWPPLATFAVQLRYLRCLASLAPSRFNSISNHRGGQRPTKSGTIRSPPRRNPSAWRQLVCTVRSSP
jgi:hypothetical protein